ncbi:MAG TPA: beta-eliminating lyase-related protein, partial [Polyangiaceae bacterium]|nr:beta-eliminating lyase-related protein [Polyangiaceae bacterium]
MQRPPPPEPERRQEIFRACDRFLHGHGPRRIPAELAALAAAAGDAGPDVYGKGGALEELERDVARLLGKPAALFLPSGTMAQQIALRLHAEAARCRRVAFHPTCHLELHEQRAYAELHGLEARLVGRRDQLLELADLEAVGEPLAALLLELPQRELGGVLPSWAELTAQADWARGSGVALHLDGARLWESAPFYGKSHAEIAALFDSVYVSFYKVLGAIAGALLAGSEALVAGARVWQRRHGGNLVSMYPYALSARAGLAARLGRLGEYHARAQRIAALWRSLDGVRVTPDPPHTNMFHAYFPVAGEALLAASAE